MSKEVSYQELKQYIAKLEQQIASEKLKLGNAQNKLTKMDAEVSSHTDNDHYNLVKSAPVCIHEINLQGNLVHMNKAGLEMIGLSTEQDVINIPYLELVGPHNRKRIEDLMKEAFSGDEVSHFEFTVETDQGLKRFDSNFIPIKAQDGVVTSLMGVSRDITEQYEHQQATVLAKQRAERENLEKSQLLANVSHELRTPMNGILGASQILQDETTDPAQKQLVEIIYQSSLSMLSILNDIIDLSAQDLGQLKLRPAPYHIITLVKECHALFKINAQNKKLSYTLQLSPNLPTETVYGDAVRIKQILCNLISNAIKFTQDGKVTVTADFQRKEDEDGLLIVKISDTGIGISKKDQQRIFLPFTQVDMSYTKNYTGTGLGLTISQQLSRAMQGELTLKSQAGSGSQFIFKLPLRLSKEKTGKETEFTPVLPNKNYQKKLLVVDDNEINRHIICRMLGNSGLQIDTAENGQVAIQLCSTTKYDLILMDIHMPVINGLESADAIQKLPGYADTPIIALTASVLPKEKQVYKKHGMLDVVEKPFTLNELHRTLEFYF